jgi:CTP:molybdopterin cytidylyltransferase MocA
MTCAILLAAGASSRTSSPKALFKVGGKSLVQFQIDALLNGGAGEVYVVTGYHRDAIASAILPSKRVTIVVNPQPQRGMFSSILSGIEAVRDADARILIHPVDVPLPGADTLRRLIGAEGEIVIPSVLGRKGHPVIIAGELARTLFHAPQQRLDAWLRDHGDVTRYVEADEPDILQNGNTDAELSQIFSQETR